MSETSGTGRYAAVDVHYPAAGGAVAAAVVAGDRAFATILAEHLATLDTVAAYQPGSFWRRELPALRAVLAQTGPLELLIVDGYVDLDPDGSPGLGAYAHAELGVPVLGVAKSVLRGATHAAPVLRGRSARPLHVTAAGIPQAEAAELVRQMSGSDRLPDALRRVDALARGRRPVPAPLR